MTNEEKNKRLEELLEKINKLFDKLENVQSENKEDKKETKRIIMSKYCPIKKAKVVYLECLECEYKNRCAKDQSFIDMFNKNEQEDKKDRKNARP